MTMSTMPKTHICSWSLPSDTISTESVEFIRSIPTTNFSPAPTSVAAYAIGNKGREAHRAAQSQSCLAFSPFASKPCLALLMISCFLVESWECRSASTKKFGEGTVSWTFDWQGSTLLLIYDELNFKFKFYSKPIILKRRAPLWKCWRQHVPARLKIPRNNSSPVHDFKQIFDQGK